MATTGVVLAGGASTRMGSDKAFVVVGGRPMAAIAVDALVAAGAGEVLAVGGDRDRLAGLGCVAVPDRWPGAGPLAGLVTALSVAAFELVAVLACDLPRVTAAAVSVVVGALAGAPGAAVALPWVDGRPQPLLAAYRRSALPALERSLAGGVRAVREALAGLPTVPVTLADPGWATNVNRPEELPPP
jgi:molybdopterin-guanine dinucleotide biosynthesis protein A